MSKRLFKTFVALLAIAAAAINPAWGQNGNLLTTITPTSLTTYDETTPGVVNVILDGQLEYNNDDGWQAEYRNGYQGSVTVTAKPGFSIDSCKFYVYFFSSYQDSYTVTAAPFAVYPYCVGSNQKVFPQPNAQGNEVGYFGGVKRIDVYGSAQLYTVRMAAGTEEAANWSIASGDASVTGTQVLENVMSGSQVTVTYSGTRKVKSVKAVKYVPPAATVTTAPTATEGIIEAGSTAALVGAGAANGGTMMYAVTTTNAQPASTADFSATRPTAEGRTAGTYYVWYYAKADADHSDSEIAGPVSVTLVVITTVTWNSSNISNLEVMGTFQSYTMEGITLSANANMNNAEWQDRGDESRNGITFQANQSGGYTFTAPTGKKFIKIEMTPNGQGGWDLASLGTGWAYADDSDPMTMNMICKVTWKGSAASTVGLLTGANNFGGEAVKSIVFTLIND